MNEKYPTDSALIFVTDRLTEVRTGALLREQVLDIQKELQKTAILCTALRKVKVKVQFTLEQDTKAQRGSRGITVLFP